MEFSDSITGIMLQCVERQLGQMPRIIDQDPEQKTQYLALQQRRQALKQSLQGRNG